MQEQARLERLRERAKEMAQRLMTEPRNCGETAADHCLRVGDCVATLARPLDEPLCTYAVCAGYLHDVLEDTVDPTDPASYERRAGEIREAFGPEVLRIVEAVTVNQLLKPEVQLATFTRRAEDEFREPECLVKLADLLDNWPTRNTHLEPHRSLWETYARAMINELIPARLRFLGWLGVNPIRPLTPSPGSVR